MAFSANEFDAKYGTHTTYATGNAALYSSGTPKQPDPVAINYAQISVWLLVVLILISLGILFVAYRNKHVT